MRMLHCPYCDHVQTRFLEMENRWMLVACEGCGKTFEGRRTVHLASLDGPKMEYESRSRWTKRRKKDRSKDKAQRKARKRGRR
jgi:hypothetical protein